jgi:phosphohistidine phosphatase SixA
MSRIRLTILALLLALPAAPDIARADDTAARAALRAGAHIALMRHTDAPGGAGDPPGFRLEDCATQRNLSDKGRSDAAKIGARLKAEGIRIEKILSSPWCRCMETARLLQLGPVEAAPPFSNVFVLRDQMESLTAGAREVIDAWKGSGILLVVTHGANIFALTGVSPASGEIVVVRGGSREAVGRLLLD